MQTSRIIETNHISTIHTQTITPPPPPPPQKKKKKKKKRKEKSVVNRGKSTKSVFSKCVLRPIEKYIMLRCFSRIHSSAFIYSYIKTNYKKRSICRFGFFIIRQLFLFFFLSPRLLSLPLCLILHVNNSLVLFTA